MNKLPIKQRVQMFVAPLMRKIMGYKYKIVYTELEVNGSFKRRYMAKLKMETSNAEILKGLPKVKGAGYLAPFIIYYSKNETPDFLNKRIQLKPKDTPLLVFKAYFV